MTAAATIENGSKVRVTFEGKVEENYYGEKFLKTDSGAIQYIPEKGATVTVIEKPLPKEPPADTMVGDMFGYFVFKRRGSGKASWYRVRDEYQGFSGRPGKTWQEVVDLLGGPGSVRTFVMAPDDASVHDLKKGTLKLKNTTDNRPATAEHKSMGFDDYRIEFKVDGARVLRLDMAEARSLAHAILKSSGGI